MGRWIFHRAGGSVPGLTAGCGHTTRAVAIATRPLGCCRRECEMGDHDTDGCCHMDWNFLWNYCFWSIKIRTMRTSKFYHIGIMTTQTFVFFFPVKLVTTGLICDVTPGAVAFCWKRLTLWTNTVQAKSSNTPPQLMHFPDWLTFTSYSNDGRSFLFT